MPQSFLNLLTKEDISSPEIGRAIGQVILQRAPEIFPEKIGNWEPIEAPCRSPDDFAHHWRWPVLAKKRKPCVEFSVWFRKPHRRYSSLHLSFDSAAGSAVRSDLLAELAAITKADFGMIQDLSAEYRARADARHLLQFTDKRRQNCFLSLTDESLADGLPDAFDAMWLPAQAWDIDAQDLLAPRPGIFILRDQGSKSRDEALSAIRKKG